VAKTKSADMVEATMKGRDGAVRITFTAPRFNSCHFPQNLIFRN